MILQLVDEYQLDVVLSYMSYIQVTAEQSVRSLMKKIASKNIEEVNDTCVLTSEDFMDDGSNINLRVEIDNSTVIL